ncbi:hypothetical protein DR66_294 [Delftia acidovorans]|uniref:TIGR03118 family protein n=1 Tax=Delftia acidovorans TaxID=80866 RepID=UPI000504A585|nr:TIGR03118 family protein [Delftia acidovorans]KFJ08990.1 hypothetical protein DR66_294 [Delftia acidovorans]QQB50607.1 TIGR03118 family protein [Delftia acidovorans]
MLDRRHFVLSALASSALTACGGGAPANRYFQTPLLASHAGYGARFTEPDFVNGWGIAIRPAGAGGHFWIGGGGTSWQFLGDVSRSSEPSLRTLRQDGLRKVAVPQSDSRIDDGSVSAWTERDAETGAIVRVDGPAVEVFDGTGRGMAFFGAALHTGRWDRLWLADFGDQPQIRTLDAQWQLTPTQGFVNPFASGPAGVARPGDPVPFNIQVVNDGSRDRVFVLYAMSQPDPEDASAFFAGEEDAMDAEREAATGNRPARGKLAEFDLDGRLQRIYSDDGRLNAPWGVAIAPHDFGPLSGRLLVGNFGGAGRICAFDLDSGSYVDELRDGQDRPVAIPGLWALQFGNGVALGDSNALYFAAGPKDETEGLFGSLRFG